MVEIRAEKLRLSYPNGNGGVNALAGLSARFQAGSLTAIVGASGCGKTTLLRSLAGLQKIDSGSIEFTTSKEGRTTPRVGYMFQDARLLPWLTVRKNLELAYQSDRIDQEAIARNLNMVGLKGWGNERPKRLSGGMAQRAALARALCREPELLLLDEPFGALDAFTRARLQAEVATLLSGLGTTTVLVTHDIEEAVFIADRVAVMEAGSFKNEIDIALPRPRERRSAAFQKLCGMIESELPYRIDKIASTEEN